MPYLASFSSAQPLQEWRAGRTEVDPGFESGSYVETKPININISFCHLIIRDHIIFTSLTTASSEHDSRLIIST